MRTVFYFETDYAMARGLPVIDWATTTIWIRPMEACAARTAPFRTTSERKPTEPIERKRQGA
jgi:hypothetical protein